MGKIRVGNKKNTVLNQIWARKTKGFGKDLTHSRLRAQDKDVIKYEVDYMVNEIIDDDPDLDASWQDYNDRCGCDYCYEHRKKHSLYNCPRCWDTGVRIEHNGSTANITHCNECTASILQAA